MGGIALGRTDKQKPLIPKGFSRFLGLVVARYGRGSHQTLRKATGKHAVAHQLRRALADA